MPTEDWAELREQQLKTLALRNTAMAVTIDIGNPDNVHPTDKVDVGHRLALAARALSYGEDDRIFRADLSAGNAGRECDSGVVRSSRERAGCEGRGTDRLRSCGGGREVCAGVRARIEGDTVVVTSDAVAEPAYVRYGWANSPQCNLFNGEGLPASPFSSAE